MATIPLTALVPRCCFCALLPTGRLLTAFGVLCLTTSNAFGAGFGAPTHAMLGACARLRLPCCCLATGDIIGMLGIHQYIGEKVSVPLQFGTQSMEWSGL